MSINRKHNTVIASSTRHGRAVGIAGLGVAIQFEDFFSGLPRALRRSARNDDILSSIFFRIVLILALYLLLIAPTFSFAEDEPADYILDQEGEFTYIVTLPDPIEGYNKFVLHFNKGFDGLIIRPIVAGYRVFPKPVRCGIYNAFQNLREPVNLANDILQFKPMQAVRTIWRFVVNSTIGIGGIFDVGCKVGLEKNQNGFDNTLKHYGVCRGIYVMLPLVGPSSSRAAVGLIVDALLDPIDYILGVGAVYTCASCCTEMTIERDNYYEEINSLLHECPEPYCLIKSVYEQKNRD